ncbi:MAG: AMP-binding protein [Desulfobacterales bacterium]|jgi:acyl-CoA synthetase (AMP-forming)/AMP-acid ligase II
MRHLNLYDLFGRNAALYGNRPALVDEKGTLNFKDLRQRVARTAAALKHQGIQPGDRVAVLAFNSRRYIYLLGAAARLGAILVPLNWRLSEEELLFILKDAQPGLLFYDPPHAPVATQLAQSCEQSMEAVDLETMVTTTGDLATQAGEDLDIPADGDTPFCIIYTAAMGGTPRGAVLSHANFIFSNLQTIATLHLNHGDTYLNMLPLFHITGLNLALSVMHAGGQNAIIERFNAQQVLQWTEEAHISVLGSFPPILSNLMEELDRHPRDMSSLRHVLGLDHPDTIAAFEKRTASTFWTLYGQTETSGFVTLAPVGDKPGSAGRQGLLTKFRLVDDDDQDVAPGDQGEIVVQGPLVFHGFWQHEELNRELFRNGWHHTGDLGHLDEEGFLWFGGRKPEKELIKPGGENVYPAEVEAVIQTHEAVVEVAVIGVPDPKFGEGIKAVCVLEGGPSLTAEDLAAFVAARIASYKKPRYVEFVAELPKTADGAIDRAQVKALYGQS